MSSQNPNTQALATSAPEDTLAALMDKHRDQLARALPSKVSIERFARIALTESKKTPELLKCSPASVMGSVMQAAQLGLEFGSVLGHAYLIPYKSTATLMIGYKGYIELAIRSGKVVNIKAECAYANDEFEVYEGTDPKIVHKPARGDRGELIASYAIAWFKDGSKQFVVLYKADIEKRRQSSKMPNSEPWTKFYPQMAKKSAVRGLKDYLPLSPELRQVLDEVERDEDAIDVEFSEVGHATAPAPAPAPAPATHTDTTGRHVNTATGEVTKAEATLFGGAGADEDHAFFAAKQAEGGYAATEEAPF